MWYLSSHSPPHQFNHYAVEKCPLPSSQEWHHRPSRPRSPETLIYCSWRAAQHCPKQYQLHSRTFQSNEGWRGSEAIVVLQATLWKFYKQRVWDFQSNVQPSCIQATSSISSGSSSVGLVGGTNTCQFWHEGQNNPSAQCLANKFDLSWLYTLLRQSIHDTALIGSVDTPSTCRILWFFTRHFHPNIRK